MASLNPIRTEADHDTALARVTLLMDALTTPDGQIDDVSNPSRIELEALVALIEVYEDERHPIGSPNPATT